MLPGRGGVYPPTYTGPKIEPAFDGLMCAYNYYCGGGDTVTAGRPRVKPGDTILVHAGLYKYHPEYYTGDRTINATTPFEGTYYLTANGTPEKPIVIKGAGDGEVIFDGNGNFNLFNVKAADYNYFEGMTFRNTDIAIWAGTQFIAGSKGLTVKNCRFEDVGMGVFTNYSGSSNFYIADNYFIGRNDPKHLIGWTGAFWAQFDGVDGQKFPPVMASYIAVRLYGPGHVVAYNYVANFHDGIDIETYGNPGRLARHRRPALSAARVLGPAAGRDRLLQQLHDQLPRQPVRDRRQHAQRPRDAEHDDQLGVAPVLQPAGDRRADLLDPQHRLPRARRIDAADQRRRRRALLQQHDPDGDHRRIVGERALAQQPDARRELRARDLQREHQHELQLVGLQRLPSQSRRGRFVPVELAAAGATAADYTGLRGGRGGRGIRSRRAQFATLAEYSQATHQDQHSVAVDYDIFVNVPSSTRRISRRCRSSTRREDFDFRLKPGSAAVDRGVVLPNVTDGFTGAAPDLGALEVGQPPPHYGPRD